MPEGIQGQRVRVDKGHESIRREALQDPRLSFKATGMLAYLLSLPDNWHTNAERLSGAKNRAGKAREGREAMQSGLRELEEAGYLLRRKYQDERGAWRWIWRYSDNPPDLHEQSISAGQPVNGSPVDGSAEFGSPVDGSPVDLEVLDVEVLDRDLEVENPKDMVTADASTDHDEPDEQLDLFGWPATSSRPGVESRRSRAELDELWQEFWQVYPRKVAKIKAKTAWTKAVKIHDPREIINGAARYAQQQARPDLKPYTKHPATWLNDGCWDDDPTPPPVINGNGRNGHAPYQNPINPDTAYEGTIR